MKDSLRRSSQIRRFFGKADTSAVRESWASGQRRWIRSKITWGRPTSLWFRVPGQKCHWKNRKSFQWIVVDRERTWERRTHCTSEVKVNDWIRIDRWEIVLINIWIFIQSICQSSNPRSREDFQPLNTNIANWWTFFTFSSSKSNSNRLFIRSFSFVRSANGMQKRDLMNTSCFLLEKDSFLFLNDRKANYLSLFADVSCSIVYLFRESIRFEELLLWRRTGSTRVTFQLIPKKRDHAEPQIHRIDLPLNERTEWNVFVSRNRSDLRYLEHDNLVSDRCRRWLANVVRTFPLIRRSKENLPRRRRRREDLLSLTPCEWLNVETWFLPVFFSSLDRRSKDK